MDMKEAIFIAGAGIAIALMGLVMKFQPIVGIGGLIAVLGLGLAVVVDYRDRGKKTQD